MRRPDNSSAERLPARATGKIPAWFFHVVSFRHPIKAPVPQRRQLRLNQVSHSRQRTSRNRSLGLGVHLLFGSRARCVLVFVFQTSRPSWSHEFSWTSSFTIRLRLVAQGRSSRTAQLFSQPVAGNA